MPRKYQESFQDEAVYENSEYSELSEVTKEKNGYAEFRINASELHERPGAVKKLSLLTAAIENWSCKRWTLILIVVLLSIVAISIGTSYVVLQLLNKGQPENTERKLTETQKIQTLEGQQENMYDMIETQRKLIDTQQKRIQILEEKPTDCYDILRQGHNVSGVYIVHPLGIPKAVYCDQEESGGGWLVFQRRSDGSEDFYRGWYEYQRGFGDITNEFWLGNQFLASLTSQRSYTLRIGMENFEHQSRFANYASFSVGSVATNYTLHVAGYSGSEGIDNDLTGHNTMQFSTKDRDNDVSKDGNCADKWKGGWWYQKCHLSNLNGLYIKENQKVHGKGIHWESWTGYKTSLQGVVMKCRPTLL